MSNHPRPNRSDGRSVAQLFATNTSLFTKDDEVSWVDVYSSQFCCPIEVEKSPEGEAFKCNTGLLSMADCKTPMRITDSEELLRLGESKASLPIFKDDSLGANS